MIVEGLFIMVTIYAIYGNSMCPLGVDNDLYIIVG